MLQSWVSKFRWNLQTNFPNAIISKDTRYASYHIDVVLVGKSSGTTTHYTGTIPNYFQKVGDIAVEEFTMPAAYYEAGSTNLHNVKDSF